MRRGAGSRPQGEGADSPPAPTGDLSQLTFTASGFDLVRPHDWIRKDTGSVLSAGRQRRGQVLLHLIEWHLLTQPAHALFPVSYVNTQNPKRIAHA